MALGYARAARSFAEVIAVDTSPLLAIFRGERNGTDWLNLLLRLRVHSPLVACDVVWSEVAPIFDDVETLRRSMRDVGVHFAPLDEVACYRAGHLFVAYRKRGGSRMRIVADFMIAAHALEHARGLITGDHDFMHAHFSSLRLFRP
jgi:predicted nucleic acid-binding protein